MSSGSETVEVRGVTTMRLSVDSEDPDAIVYQPQAQESISHDIRYPGNQSYVETLSHDESDQETPQRHGKRTVFGPHVTVNVFNTGGSTTGGSTTGGSGSGAGGTGAGGDASVSGGAFDGTLELIPSMTSQIVTLSREFEQLKSLVLSRRPIIESGTWTTNSVRSWHPPQKTTEGPVSFTKEFVSTPTVLVSINSADVSNGANFRAKVYATNVHLKGFTIHAESWSDTRLFSCGLSWIAVSE